MAGDELLVECEYDTKTRDEATFGGEIKIGKVLKLKHRVIHRIFLLPLVLKKF
jgi:hypothetical protein